MSIMSFFVAREIFMIEGRRALLEWIRADLAAIARNLLASVKETCVKLAVGEFIV